MLIQKIRNNALGAFKGHKGFTLVEVIVVLVILAILAAILVPRLTGWIDESKGKAATGEAHLVLTALQSVGSEQYGDGTLTGALDVDPVVANDAIVTAANVYLANDVTLSPTTLTAYAISAQGAVTGFTYVASNGETVTYTYTVGDANGSFTTN